MISCNAISILLGKVVLITELHIVVVCCPGQFTLIGEGTPHWFGALSFSFIYYCNNVLGKKHALLIG